MMFQHVSIISIIFPSSSHYLPIIVPLFPIIFPLFFHYLPIIFPLSFHYLPIRFLGFLQWDYGNGGPFMIVGAHGGPMNSTKCWSNWSGGRWQDIVEMLDNFDRIIPTFVPNWELHGGLISGVTISGFDLLAKFLQGLDMIGIGDDAGGLTPGVKGFSWFRCQMLKKSCEFGHIKGSMIPSSDHMHGSWLSSTPRDVRKPPCGWLMAWLYLSIVMHVTQHPTKMKSLSIRYYLYMMMIKMCIHTYIYI